MAESSDVKPADEQITIQIQLADNSPPLKLKVKRGTKFEKVFGVSPPRVPCNSFLFLPGQPLQSFTQRSSPRTLHSYLRLGILQEQVHGAWQREVCVVTAPPLTVCLPFSPPSCSSPPLHAHSHAEWRVGE